MNTFQLNIDPSEKKRIEAFINQLEESVEQQPFACRTLKESNRIVDATQFTNANKSLTITVVCVKSYEDASHIASANFTDNGIRWGQNGSIMYWVESDNEDMIDTVVSLFAGRE